MKQRSRAFCPRIGRRPGPDMEHTVFAVTDLHCTSWTVMRFAKKKQESSSKKEQEEHSYKMFLISA